MEIGSQFVGTFYRKTILVYVVESKGAWFEPTPNKTF